MSRAGAAPPFPSPRSAGLALLLAFTACARAPGDAQAARRRCLTLVDTLPRLEAEQRAWPRSDSLYCEERGEARAVELRALRRELEESCGAAQAPGDLAPIFEAADEVEACAACAPDHTAHCARARELFVEMQTALEKAGLR
jgi:hypothetical protein